MEYDFTDEFFGDDDSKDEEVELESQCPRCQGSGCNYCLCVDY